MSGRRTIGRRIRPGRSRSRSRSRPPSDRDGRRARPSDDRPASDDWPSDDRPSRQRTRGRWKVEAAAIGKLVVLHAGAVVRARRRLLVVKKAKPFVTGGGPEGVQRGSRGGQRVLYIIHTRRDKDVADWIPVSFLVGEL
eukprot:909558-Prorocentrum_minimum.AAC.1